MPKFIVEGGQPLRGTVRIHGSKNASLPILAATLLTDEPCTLRNVPDISDVHAFIKILEGFGAEVEFSEGVVTVQTAQIRSTHAPHELVKQMRASILLLGPVLAREGLIEMVFPGGCVLGKRSVQAHTRALTKLGARITENESGIKCQTDRLKGTRMTMSEASVTATENTIMAAVLADGITEIHWSAMEPHVQDLCHFLNAMGAKIEGIGSPTLTIQGVDKLRGTDYTVTSDYLAAGTLALAALLTRGDVTLENVAIDHLDSFWEKLEQAGARFEFESMDEMNQNPSNESVDQAGQTGLVGQSVSAGATHAMPGTARVHIKPLPEGESLQAVEQLKTAVFPGFATDLQAPFTVLLTQAEGESRVFETLFEGRLNYLFELEKMGAKIDLHNPQQATIHGITPLKGAEIASCDIRAGAAMVLAALCAEGTTEISNIRYIDRGYERLDETLRELGAKIERVEPS